MVLGFSFLFTTSVFCIEKRKQNVRRKHMKKTVLFEKRKKARELKKKGWSNLRIAR
jgi:hypothetical protein